MTGTYAELVQYFKTTGYEKVRVSTIVNAVTRKINIYKHKIEKL